MASYLTTKQKQFFDFLRTYIEENQFAPTLSELQQYFGITKRGIVKHLEALERKGFIGRNSESRGIQLLTTTASMSFRNLNILGYANAGSPMVIAQEQQIGTLRVKKTLLPVFKDLFALIIKGDSMNRRLLNGSPLSNGNYAIVARDQEVRDGDVVLAIIDNCATIKTIKKDRQMIVLYPESTNPVHKPIYLSRDDGEVIYGKVISVLENPSPTF
jgi:repressor LexA